MSLSSKEELGSLLSAYIFKQNDVLSYMETSQESCSQKIIFSCYSYLDDTLN